MNKFLRLTFVAAFAVVSSFSFAQTVVKFDVTNEADRMAGQTAASAVEITKDNVTLSISNGIANNGYAYRIYKGETLTLTSANAEITKIEMECDTYSDGKYLADGFELAAGQTISADKVNATWEGTAKSVVFTATNHQVRAKNVTVTLKGDVTGINDVVTAKADADAPLYNLAGQRVGADYKGVVLQNGKKFVQK